MRREVMIHSTSTVYIVYTCSVYLDLLCFYIKLGAYMDQYYRHTMLRWRGSLCPMHGLRVSDRADRGLGSHLYGA